MLSSAAALFFFKTVHSLPPTLFGNLSLILQPAEGHWRWKCLVNRIQICNPVTSWIHSKCKCWESQSHRRCVDCMNAVVKLSSLNTFLPWFSASDVVSFDGGSSLTYRPGPASRRGPKQVAYLKFKTLRNSGTLLHAEGRDGLGLSLELERGKLQLLLREGATLLFNAPLERKSYDFINVLSSIQTFSYQYQCFVFSFHPSIF